MSVHSQSDGRQRANMTDVAKLAGVSHQTVSRVLNGSQHVRVETRDRVLEAMTMLDYRPSSFARALATGRSRTLGVISFDTTLYGPASTLLAIERAAHDEDYFVSVASLRSLDPESVVSAVDRLRGQGVDGIVTIAPLPSARSALAALPPGVPVVAAESGPDGAMPLVEVDQFAGAVAATEHLLALGHRTVHHIAGPPGWPEAEARVAGWRATLERAGLPVPAWQPGDWDARTGYELGRSLMQDPDVTAVFVANDQMALGLLRLLHEQGRRLPEDVSVVGFDDIPEAGYFTPPLTTVRQDFMEMGRRALHLLLREIDTPSRSGERVTVAPELIVRASTAPAP